MAEAVEKLFWGLKFRHFREYAKIKSNEIKGIIIHLVTSAKDRANSCQMADPPIPRLPIASFPRKRESRIIKKLLDSGSALRAVRNDTGRIVRRLFAPACPDFCRCYFIFRQLQLKYAPRGPFGEFFNSLGYTRK
jgi:hypothetical protein